MNRHKEEREKLENQTCTRVYVLRRLSKQGRKVDALALRAEERRDKLRKATGSRKQAGIRGYLNGGTRLVQPVTV